jgi:serine/threonine-protein kinase
LVKRCAKCGRSLEGHGRACTETLVPGTILAGRYLIVRAVGRGAAATVYQALDRMLDEPVAVKVLDTPSGGFAAAERLRSEIKLARRVTHPNVCRIHDYGEDGDRRFICMELIEGRNLREVLAARGRLGAGETCAVGAQAAEALDAIHARGIVHRDVKTANLILDRAGRVYVTDFGVATGGGPVAGTPAAGYVIGTPEYMSPEQALGLRLDARSDLYALGIVLFEMLTGDVPFRGEQTAETLAGHVRQAPPLAALAAARAPESLRELIARLLAKRREDRPRSASVVAAALRALAPAETTAANVGAGPQATTVVSRTLTLPRRTRTVVAALRHGATAAAVAVIAWTIAGSVRWDEAPPVAAREPRPDTPARVVPSTPPSRAAEPRTATTSRAPEARSTGMRRPEPAEGPPTLPPRSVSALPAPVGVEPAEVRPAPIVLVMPEREPPPPGRLRFAVTPWAEVSVDGVAVGETPRRELSLPPGSYTARLVHPDFRPFQRKVTIRPGETTPLTVDLRLDGIRNR